MMMEKEVKSGFIGRRLDSILGWDGWDDLSIGGM